MENDWYITLLHIWVFWYASAALFGAFFGTLAAFGVRALYRKLRKG